jgi:hypothetical protein
MFKKMKRGKIITNSFRDGKGGRCEYLHVRRATLAGAGLGGGTTLPLPAPDLVEAPPLSSPRASTTELASVWAGAASSGTRRHLVRPDRGRQRPSRVRGCENFSFFALQEGAAD